MAGDALGRGLGNLMGGKKPVSEPEESKPAPSKVSPGMATLIQGNKPVVDGGAEKKSQPHTVQSAKPEQQGEKRPQFPNQRRVLRISLFVADGLLVLLAARVAFKSGGSFGLPEAALCAGALGMGAWLTVVALHMKQ